MPTGSLQARPRKPTPDDFEACQGVLKHAWDLFSDAEVDADVTLLCVRCTGKRYDWFDSLGNILRRHYVMPNGYDRPKGTRRPNMAEFRLKLLKDMTKAAGKPARRLPRAKPLPKGFTRPVE